MWTFPTYKTDSPLDWEALEKRFDWFCEMQDVPQDAQWHAEGNVLIHSKMVVEALIALPEFQGLRPQDKHILFAAAMMHDIEKRSCTQTQVIQDDLRIVSPGHAKKGEFTAREILYKELEAPFAIREQICKLVRLHGLPIWSISKSDPQKAAIKASLEVDTELLYLLAKADLLGRIAEDRENHLLKVELFKTLCEENDCFGKAYDFASPLARYYYLNKKDSLVSYEPYDDLKFTVIMMAALPGTGKDAYIQEQFQNDLPVLALDDIRRQHKFSPRNKKDNGKVIQLAKEQARQLLRKEKSFIFNATNLSKDRRSKWLTLFSDYKARTKIIYLEVPYQQLIKQNHDRRHKVPDDVIDKLIRKQEIPSFDEAHEIDYLIK